MTKCRVMIADDSQPLREMLQSELESLNCDVVAQTDSGGNVVLLFQREHPDILFLDINLPGKNGIEIAAEINSKNPNAYIVMISGDHDAVTVQSSVKSGARDFIAKPFTAKKLVDVINRFYAERTMTNKPIIMCADDEPLARQFLVNMLNDMGYEVRYEADSGAMLLDAIKAQQPDIVFLDIEMPGTDGFTVLRDLKSKYPSCFVVMVSGHSTFENLQKSIEFGAASFVVKPFERAKLEQVFELFDKQRNAA